MMNKVIELPWKITNRTYERGLQDTINWIWSHISWRYREWSLKIETDAWIEAGDLGFNDECHGYEPISYASFDTVTDYLSIDPQSSVFLDYGCGKGRAVILAALQPFKRVVGVELSEPLCDVARNNIEVARSKLRTPEVEIICSDAATYQIPDDVNVIFIWNSFTGSILSKVHNNIHQSLKRAPRKMTVINGVPHGEVNQMAKLEWLPEGVLLPTRFFTGVDIFAYEISGEK